MNGWDYFTLDPQYDGACACARFTYEGTEFDAHCWRVCGACQYAGLHYQGDRAVAERVLADIQALEWGEWELAEGLRPGY